ncbi:hypothetical protein [Fluviicola sp.]|uniref:hypothetical protein n=1 Tax=Fluviicola sp. TaxID=1917219 RepID=UPI0031DE2E33
MYYCYKTRLLRYVLSVSTMVFSTISFGQTSAHVDSLNSVRSQLISNGQSTSEVDMLLHQAGSNSKCIIQQLDDFTFTFVSYRPLGDAQREERVNLRLKSHYPYLNVIDFSDDFTSVRINCNVQLTPAMINELVLHFGYNGYEIH